MAPLHRTALLLWTILSFCSFFIVAQQPSSSVTYFPNFAARLFFFDDTQVRVFHVYPVVSAECNTHNQSVIYHDASDGNVYVSQDEGKAWARAEDIPEGKAAMVIEHPFDNRYVSVITTPCYFRLYHIIIGVRLNQRYNALPN